MPRPLQARHRRADGTPVVQVEVPTLFTKDEAAEALALWYATSDVVLTGFPAIQSGLHSAARERLLGSETPDPDLVQGYRNALARHEDKLFRYAEDPHSGQVRSVKWISKRLTASGDKRSLKNLGATHVRVDVSVRYDFEQAALALALHYGEFPRGVRTGRMTAERGLHAAAEQRLRPSWDEAPQGTQEKADFEAAVSEFKGLLVEQGIFEAPAEGSAA